MLHAQLAVRGRHPDGTGSKVVGKFGIAPLPGPNGHGASSLGGHSLAISIYSKHPATDFDFLKFVESDQHPAHTT